MPPVDASSPSRGDNDRAQAILEALRKARKVAIVRLGSIGDVVATLPFAWLLRDLLSPGTNIAWIAHPPGARILAGVKAINEVISLPRASLFRAIPTWRRALRQAGIEAVVDLHGNLKSALVSRLTGAGIRIGFDHADCREGWNRWVTNHTLPPLSTGNKTHRAVKLAVLLGHPAPAIRFGLEFTSEENARARGILEAVTAASGAIALLQVGRLEDIRSWAAESYASLASSLHSRGLRVLVVSGPDEVEAGEAVRRLLGEDSRGVSFELGTLSLREEGALLQALARDATRRHFFVGPDSGTLHLAVACGLRALGLFGPQDPARTAPVGPGFETLFHPEAAECIPCARRECSHPVRSYCMRCITPAEVLERAGFAPEGAGGTARAEGLPRSSLRRPEDEPQPQRVLEDRGGSRDQGGSGHILPAAALVPLTFIALLAGGGLLGLLGFHNPEELNLALRTWPCGEGLLPPGGGKPFPGLGYVALSSFLYVLGGGDLAARLLATLSGTGTAFLTYLIARRLGGHRSGLIACATLLAMWRFLWWSGLEALESMFAFLVTASLHFYLEGARDPKDGRRLPLLLSAVSAAGAFLIKGLPGLCLPALAALTFHAGERNLKGLLRPKAILAALIALGVAGSWLLWLCLAPGTEALDPHSLAYPFLGESSSSAAARAWAPFYWLFTAALPASLLAPFVLFAHLRTRRYREDLGLADRRWRFPKAALLSGLLFLAVLPLKSPVLLLPLFPMLAVLTAAWLERRLLPWTEKRPTWA